MSDQNYIMEMFSPSFQNKPRLTVLEYNLVNPVLTAAVKKMSIINQIHPQGVPVTKEDNQPVGTKLKFVRIKLPEDQLSTQQQEFKHIQKITETLISVLQEALRHMDFIDNVACFVMNEMLAQTYFNRMVQLNSISRKDISVLGKSIDNCISVSEETQNFIKDAQFCLEAAFTTVNVQKQVLERRNKCEQDCKIVQNNYKLKEIENDLKMSIFGVSSEMKKEEIVHSELNDLLKSLIDELSSKLEYWSERYNDEIDKLDINILQIQNKIDEQKPLIKNLQEDTVIKEQEIEILEKEVAIKEKESCMRIAVHIIEGWWAHLLLNRRRKNSIKSRRKDTGSKKGKKQKNK